MSKNVLITGVTVAEQMQRAKEILEQEVVPSVRLFNLRKKEVKTGQKPTVTIKLNT